MGLDFHTDGIPYEEDIPYNERAHWSYSGFNNFRERLAREVGAKCLKDVWTHDYHRQSLLYDLLAHSGCDGELSPSQCGAIFATLELAVLHWPEGDYDKVMALRLVNHMQECARMNRALKFS